MEKFYKLSNGDYLYIANDKANNEIIFNYVNGKNGKSLSNGFLNNALDCNQFNFKKDSSKIVKKILEFMNVDFRSFRRAKLTHREFLKSNLQQFPFMSATSTRCLMI